MSMEAWIGLVLGSGLPAISFTVWLIRLEGRINQHDALDTLRFTNLMMRDDQLERDQQALRTEHTELKDKIMDKLGVIERSLSNIEGRLTKHVP